MQRLLPLSCFRGPSTSAFHATFARLATISFGISKKVSAWMSPPLLAFYIITGSASSVGMTASRLRASSTALSPTGTRRSWPRPLTECWGRRRPQGASLGRKNALPSLEWSDSCAAVKVSMMRHALRRFHLKSHRYYEFMMWNCELPMHHFSLTFDFVIGPIAKRQA